MKTFVPLAIVLLLTGVGFGRASGQTLTTLYSFSYNSGENSYGVPLQNSDGDFYGTTSANGPGGAGTVFRITPQGDYTNIYSFSGPDGAYPQAGLVSGKNGFLYGTTGGGGSNSQGTVFRISPSGNLSSLYMFSGSDGADPVAPLVLGSDGNFYGTTFEGGASTNCLEGCGTVFRITPQGTLTTLWQFSGSDGSFPQAGLVQGPDGGFYGTTRFGGTSKWGTVFRIGQGSNLTTLHSFSGSDGKVPWATLVLGNDGNFYGTTSGGGTNGNEGTLFRISPSGGLTTIHYFGGGFGVDGNTPTQPLLLGSDGNFYGVTGISAFKISSTGNLTNLYWFYEVLGGAGYAPWAGLVQGSDGSLYGTTTLGGPFSYNYGTVFKLSVRLSPPANQIAGLQFLHVFDMNYFALLIPSVAGETYQLQYTDCMNPTNWNNSGDPITSIGGPLTAFDFLEPTAHQRFYRFAITP